MEFEVIASPGAPRSVGPYSQATRAGNLIFCAGQGGFDSATGKLVEGGIGEQKLVRSFATSRPSLVRQTAILPMWLR